MEKDLQTRRFDQVPQRISSRDNPRVRALRTLGHDAHVRRESGQTLLDGEHLVGEALDADLTLDCVALTEALLPVWQRRLRGQCVLVVPEALLKTISPVVQPSGIVASLLVPKAKMVSSADGDELWLENIQDPGNLGALLRTAAAAGVRTVRLSKGCAEAWSPKALRGGQGAQFRLQIAEGCDLPALARASTQPCHAAALQAPHRLYELALQTPAIFVFGNEGSGLSPELQAACQPFAIPMPGKTESLNVAAAAAITLFEAVRQREMQPQRQLRTSASCDAGHS